MNCYKAFEVKEDIVNNGDTFKYNFFSYTLEDIEKSFSLVLDREVLLYKGGICLLYNAFKDRIYKGYIVSSSISNNKTNVEIVYALVS